MTAGGNEASPDAAQAADGPAAAQATASRSMPATAAAPLCPSARPDMPGSVIFGVIKGTAKEPRLAHLVEPLPVTPEVLALTGSVDPTEVFRFAATCATSACCHFDGNNCNLVQRVVEMLPALSGDLPICRIRPTCRWWQQEGREACYRCPQVVTLVQHPSEALHRAATPIPVQAEAPSSIC